jgi:2-hydroxychromene-2-carboxylate isomerase
MIEVQSFSIYHSPNAYLGVVLAERALAGLPVIVRRRPLHVPKDRGVRVADLVGGREPPRKSGYHREDCARWAERHGIALSFVAPEIFEARTLAWRASPLAREELPARAFYAAADTGRQAELDRALFRAAWVEGEDVNDDEVVRRCIRSAGLDPERVLSRAFSDPVGAELRAALADFDHWECPGIPTWVVRGERFWGKDRVEWLAECVRRLTAPEGRSP